MIFRGLSGLRRHAAVGGVAGGDVLRFIVRLPLVSLLLVAACAPPRATLVAELPAAEPLVEKTGGTQLERYVLGPDNTEVEVEVSAGPTFSLGFSGIRGTLEIDPTDPSRSHLELTIDAHTATASIDRVAEIAMSHHFLDVEAFPTVTFASRAVTADEEGTIMTGELTLHGVTQGLAMPITVEVTPCAIAYDVAFSFDRHAFDMVAEGRVEDIVSDTVAVLFLLEVERPCPDAS